MGTQSILLHAAAACVIGSYRANPFLFLLYLLQLLRLFQAVQSLCVSKERKNSPNYTRQEKEEPRQDHRPSGFLPDRSRFLFTRKGQAFHTFYHYKRSGWPKFSYLFLLKICSRVRFYEVYKRRSIEPENAKRSVRPR